MNKIEAAEQLKQGLKENMGKLRYITRTQFQLDLSDLTDKQIVEIIFLACELYLDETEQEAPKIEFKFIWEDDSEA